MDKFMALISPSSLLGIPVNYQPELRDIKLVQESNLKM